MRPKQVCIPQSRYSYKHYEELKGKNPFLSLLNFNSANKNTNTKSKKKDLKNKYLHVGTCITKQEGGDSITVNTNYNSAYNCCGSEK